MKTIIIQSLSLKKIFSKQFNRFLLVGLINTIISYIIYYLGLMIMNYIYSYFLSIFISILLSAYLNSIFVFKINTRRITLIPFIFIFLLQGLIGGKFLTFWIVGLNIPETIAPLLNIFFITPIIFTLNRKISKFMR